MYTAPKSQTKYTTKTVPSSPPNAGEVTIMSALRYGEVAPDDDGDDFDRDEEEEGVGRCCIASMREIDAQKPSWPIELLPSQSMSTGSRYTTEQAQNRYTYAKELDWKTRGRARGGEGMRST